METNHSTKPKAFQTGMKPKPPLRDFRLAKPLPPDHWIYKQGPQIGFVRGLPQSIKDLRSKATAAPSPETTSS